MSKPAPLDEAKALRQRAWALVRGDVASIRAELAARPLTERVKDQAVTTASEALDQAVAVGRENKPVIAGTITALALWLGRRPLFALLGRLTGRKVADPRG